MASLVAQGRRRLHGVASSSRGVDPFERKGAGRSDYAHANKLFESPDLVTIIMSKLTLED